MIETFRIKQSMTHLTSMMKLEKLQHDRDMITQQDAC